jgi:hypothetical protein
MDTNTAGKIVQAVYDNLQHAEVIAMAPAPSHSIVREDYWEHAWIVTWKRELRNGQPDKSGDGMTYATHRVHVNSKGDAACFDGNYDQERSAALVDMCKRASIEVPTHDAQDKIDRLHRDLELSVCYSPQAIRDSFDGADKDHPDAAWARLASDEELLEVSQSIVGSDPTWRDFHRNIELGIEWMRTKKE